MADNGYHDAYRAEQQALTTGTRPGDSGALVDAARAASTPAGNDAVRAMQGATAGYARSLPGLVIHGTDYATRLDGAAARSGAGESGSARPESAEAVNAPGLKPEASGKSDAGATKSEPSAGKSDAGATKSEPSASKSDTGTPKSEPSASKSDTGTPKSEPSASKSDTGTPKSEPSAGKAGEGTQIIPDGNGGQTRTSKNADGTTTESYTPGLPHSTIKSADGKVLYGDSVDKAGNYTQTGVTADGGAWTMTSDKNGPTSSQNWAGNGDTSSWSKDAASGNTTDTRSSAKGDSYATAVKDSNGKELSADVHNKDGVGTLTTDQSGNQTASFTPTPGSSVGAQSASMDATGKVTDQQKWSADGNTRTQVNPTADNGVTSRTYGGNGQETDYHHWKADGSSVQSGPKDGGGHYSMSLDAKGNVTQMTERDKDNNYTKSGPTHEGGAFSQTKNAQGQVTDDHYWGKNGDSIQSGVSASGQAYTNKTSADGLQSSFKDKTGTAETRFNSDGSSTTKFTTADGDAGHNYTETADGHGNRTRTDLAGTTTRDAQGNATAVKSDGGMTSSITTNKNGQLLDNTTYHPDGTVVQSAGPHGKNGPYTMVTNPDGYPSSFITAQGTHSYSYERSPASDGGQAKDRPTLRTKDTFTPAPIVTSWESPASGSLPALTIVGDD